MLSILGLAAALALLIYLTIRGMNLLIAAPLCAVLIALSGGLALFPDEAAQQADYVSSYMAGFSNFIQSWFFMFLLGSIFGKFMEDSGAAQSVAQWVIGKLGTKSAPFAVVMACAVLTYGGVSVYVVAFSAFPIALNLFKQANLPRRFIPGALAFGSVTFTMTSAGSPEIQNWIPVKYLGTTPYAGWEVSLVVAVLMASLGFWWLNRMLKKAVARGESFESRATDTSDYGRDLPHPLLSLAPLAAVLGVSFFFHEEFKQAALILALLTGCLVSLLIHFRFFRHVGQAAGDGAFGALIAIGNTAAVVGFGAVAQASPAFDMAVNFITSLPVNPLVGAAIAVTVIAGLTGSAAGGQSIALPILGPHYTGLGVDPDALHRVVAISSGALDSLPHNGYVVTTIRAICNEKHRDAYGPVGILTVIVPLLGLIVALALFLLF
ncbi:MAG: GntP family permease [Porticoccaceae bacterium]